MAKNSKPLPQKKKNDFMTENVLEAILASGHIEAFLHDYVDSFTEITLKDYLNILIEKHNLKKSVIIKESQLGEPFTRQLFSGIRSKPSRDKVLALAIAMKITLEECQKLLRAAQVNELYPKNRRDAIIIYGLAKKLTVPQVNDILYEMEEFTL